MSHIKVSKANYNPDTKMLEVMCHSNNVWPKTDRPAEYPLTNDDEIFGFIKDVACKAIQMRKWGYEFCTLFAEFPELIMWAISWEEYWRKHEEVDALIEANKAQIVARFKELTLII